MGTPGPSDILSDGTPNFFTYTVLVWVLKMISDLNLYTANLYNKRKQKLIFHKIKGFCWILLSWHNGSFTGKHVLWYHHGFDVVILNIHISSAYYHNVVKCASLWCWITLWNLVLCKSHGNFMQNKAPSSQKLSLQPPWVSACIQQA